MVPNPATFENGVKPRSLKDTLQRHSSKLQKGQNARPAMRCRSAMSVEELSNLTRKINIQMAQPTGAHQKKAFGRSHSSPADMEPSRMMGTTRTKQERYGSYSDGSVSSTGSSVSYIEHLVNVPIAPPSRYHTSARFHRKVHFNERVEVFELPLIPPEDMPIELKQKIKKTKNDTIQFHDQKQRQRSSRRVQERMTSFIKDKLKSN